MQALKRRTPRGCTAAHSLYWLRLFLSLCCSMAATALQAAPALVIDDAFKHVNLSEHLDILDEDVADRNSADVPDTHAAQFRPASASEVSEINGPRWVRFGVINQGAVAQTLILQIQPATTELNTLVRAGVGVTLQAQPPSALNPDASTLQIHLPAHASGLFYLHVAGKPLFPTDLQLFSIDQYVTTASRQGWIGGIELGLFLMLLVVSGLICSLNRDYLFLLLTTSTLLHALPLLSLHLGKGSTLTGDTSTMLAITWLLVTACVLQLTLRYPAVPKNSKAWHFALRAGSLILAVAAVVLGLMPQWISFNLMISILLPALVLTTASAAAGYLSYPRQLQMEFAVSRLTILLAVAATALLQPLQHNLPLNRPSLLTMIAALDMLLLTVLLIRRGLRNMVIADKRQRSVAAAEAESRVRTELTASVAHHIRTPVSGVLGMIEMLQDTSLSTSQRTSLNMIERAGNELLNAVNELSDISRLDLSADPLQRGNFDLQALIAECIEGFRGLASARHLELIADLPPNLPRFVTGDQTRLRQLLLQLIHHGIAQFSRGEILLRAETKGLNQLFILTVHGERTAETTQLGNQIDPTLRPAIARQLTSTLGGSIHIAQPTSSSWRASVELPLPMLERTQTASQLEHNLRHRRVLIVDDSATFCAVIQRQLEHWGMHVHTAGTLSEGLARLNNQRTINQPIDVLLLDAELPELADDAVYARVQEASPTSVMLLTTQPEAEHAALAQTLAVRRVLLKPIDQISLQLALAEELAQPEPRLVSPRREQQPLNCLIAEDNPINAQVLQGLLNKLGATSVVAVNGQEAVEVFQRQLFDLVLMDCDMPIMDGFEAARQIREIQHNRGVPPTPIIALTANTREELGERARTAVMDAHLVKPVRLHALQQLLEHWSGRSLAPKNMKGEIEVQSIESIAAQLP